MRQDLSLTPHIHLLCIIVLFHWHFAKNFGIADISRNIVRQRWNISLTLLAWDFLDQGYF